MKFEMTASRGTLLQQFELVLQIAKAQWKAEQEKTYLGVVWSIAEPLLNMLVYYVVFSYFLGTSTPNFVVFLLVGIVAWNWFASNIVVGQLAILLNKGLLRQAPINKSIPPLAQFVSSLNEFAFDLIVIELFLLWYGIHPSRHYFALPLLIGVETLLILGVVLPLSAVVPFFPDLGNLVGHIVRMTFYFTGIFYAPETIRPKYLDYFYMNPMAVIVTSYREILIYNKWPTMAGHLTTIACVSLLGIAFGLQLLRRYDGAYVKRIFK